MNILSEKDSLPSPLMDPTCSDTPTLKHTRTIFSVNTSEILPDAIHSDVRRIIHHKQVGLPYTTTRLISCLKNKFIMRTK